MRIVASLIPMDSDAPNGGMDASDDCNVRCLWDRPGVVGSSTRSLTSAASLVGLMLQTDCG